jgi:hypothetical protein
MPTPRTTHVFSLANKLRQEPAFGYVSSKTYAYAIESCYAISPTGRAIAYSTKQPFQHTAILSLEDGKLWRYESLVGDGFVRREFSRRTDVVTTWFSVTHEEHGRGLEWLRNYVGTKYPSVFLMAMEYLFPPLRDLRRRSYCSKSAMMFLKSMGLWRNHVDSRRVPKPHPGVPFLVAETLAILRPSDSLLPVRT